MMSLTQNLMPRVNILGVGITPLNIPLTLQIIDSWLALKEQKYICVTGVHGVMESQQDDNLRQIHNKAGLVTPDGMPLVWLSRAQGFQQVDRVYGPDLMLALCKHSEHRGYRHFLYGSTWDVLEQLQNNLILQFPKLNLAGAYAPPFRPLTTEEDAEIVHQINQTLPDIVWIGLSTPKQERWMAAHLGKIQAPVMIGVGAAFDFHAGIKKQAPRWMQKSGLEWFFRLIMEPQRLGKRYLINNPIFVFLILAQAFGLKKYSLEVTTQSG